jgi:hypothetical protein
MSVLKEKARPARRAVAISAMRSYRICMAKTHGAVAIGRCGMAKGDRRFDIVSNRPGGIQCRGTISLVQCVIYVRKNATIWYDGCTGNSGWTDKSENFIWQTAWQVSNQLTWLKDILNERIWHIARHNSRDSLDNWNLGNRSAAQNPLMLKTFRNKIMFRNNVVFT